MYMEFQYIFSETLNSWLYKYLGFLVCRKFLFFLLDIDFINSYISTLHSSFNLLTFIIVLTQKSHASWKVFTEEKGRLWAKRSIVEMKKNVIERTKIEQISKILQFNLRWNHKLVGQHQLHWDLSYTPNNLFT